MKLQNGHGRQFIDIPVCDSYGQGCLFQSLPAAAFTGGDAHKALILLPHDLRAGFPVTALHIFNKALKGHIVDALAALSLVTDLHMFSAHAVYKYLLNLRVKIFIRGIQIKMIFFRQSL